MATTRISMGIKTPVMKKEEPGIHFIRPIKHALERRSRLAFQNLKCVFRKIIRFEDLPRSFQEVNGIIEEMLQLDVSF